MKLRTLLAVAVVVCGAASPGFAQDASLIEDLQFAQQLRVRGDHGLAMEFLKRLSKNPSPELAKQLPLELAKTNLAAAAEEQDTTKRLLIYQQARAEFQSFLDKNPGHPRTAETNLDIAQVAIQEGHTQLSRALIQETEQARMAEAVKARTTLTGAGERLDAARQQLQEQLKKLADAKTPAEKAQAKKLEDDLLHAEVSRALSYFDVALTYVGTDIADRTARGGQVELARAALVKFDGKDDVSPIVWEVRAWHARCLNELGEPQKAMIELKKLIAERRPEAARGRRLARFFAMLVVKENPAVAENKNPLGYIKDSADAWLREYPNYTKTSEGYGVRYLLAWAMFSQIEQQKPPPTEAQRVPLYDDVRKQLRPIEQTDNDYTDEARRLKVTAIGKQGGFTKPIEELKKFEECAARAQYEIYQISEDMKKATTAADKEKKRAERQKNALTALERGLGLDDAKPDGNGKTPYEVNNARVTLTYFYLDAKRYKDAAKMGESLARNDSRAPQAPTAAMLALEACAQLVAEREKKFETEAEMKEDQDHMLDLAKYLEETWKNELPAEMARHEVGLLLLRRRKVREGIVKLSTITPAYTGYVFARYQLGEAALQADRDKLDPIEGDKPGAYRDRAIKAFESIPESALGADPATNQAVVMSRLRLGQELFLAKKYEDMEKLVDGILPKLAKFSLSPDPAQDKDAHEKMQAGLTEIKLYARLGLADAALKANQPAKVAELLDSVIDQINAGAYPNLSKNPQLGYSLISLEVKSNTLLNKLDRTGLALQAMKQVSGGSGGSTSILNLLSDVMRDQIDEARKKNDADSLKKLQDGFGKILTDLAKQEANPTPEFNYLLARGYSSLGMHDKVVALLDAVAEPKPKTGEKEVEKAALDLYHSTRVLYIGALRLNKNYDKAKEKLDEIMGEPKKPGWGATHLDALLEQVLLLEDTEKYAAAAKLSNKHATMLRPKISANDGYREKYFEFYYHTAYGFCKYGQAIKEKEKDKGEKAIRDAAKQIVGFEKSWNGFGSEESTKRFQGLLESEADLKAEYDKQKAATIKPEK